ncbi:protein SPT2 homolog isoform X2 [Aricia agestis]|uniref:protein SPT2 homolog isoform X2 n=1 Tax=Aricia agestis TaxID=91739 RepID=UPI001C2081CD|nr:protein SPT2 homolog isoform X2 [Aricia agestis]
MEFRDTLLAAQRNQQQKSSVDSMYYKARFDPPKKEQKARDKLSANIQKFLAKKEEEERQKKEEATRKREELLAMRDPKALRKIQKTLKVIKSANKSVLADAVNNDHTAVTLEGPEQPDQDDYGYESQSSAAIYEKMMEKYSKLPDEPKFSTGKHSSAKDINGTRERVKHALRHADDPVPHKRKRKGKDDRESSPPEKYEPEKKKDDKPDKPKFRKPAPPPMDFNQLLKLAEQKKSEPIEIAAKKAAAEPEPERPMTKKQKREYEEEKARRQRQLERLEAEKGGIRKVPKEEKPSIKEDKHSAPNNRRPESMLNGRIPKLSDKNNANKNDRNNDAVKASDREKAKLIDRERERLLKEKEKLKMEREKIDRERLDRLKAERDRIDREMEKLNRDREKLDKTKAKLESSRPSDKGRTDKIIDRSKLNSKDIAQKSNIDYKSQNTYRIDKVSDAKSQPHKNDRVLNGHGSQGRPVPKSSKDLDRSTQMKQKLSDGNPKVNGLKPDPKRIDASKGLLQKRLEEKKPLSKAAPGTSKPVNNSFDFDKHVSSLGGQRFPPAKRKINPDDVRRKQKRVVHSDSEYDSEMDDFIDDGDENMDYSTHIKEIFGYDKSKYRDMDDDDDPMMESSFARQQREEYISKKIGIMEDLEDMRMEAMENSKKKKRRRISDD